MSNSLDLHVQLPLEARCLRCNWEKLYFYDPDMPGGVKKILRKARQDHCLLHKKCKSKIKMSTG